MEPCKSHLPKSETDSHMLRVRRMGIDTHQEPVIYMRFDCHVCRSEGFEAHSRVLVRRGTQSILATLNVVHDHLLAHGQAGLSEVAWKMLGAREGEEVQLSHSPVLRSLSEVRGKVYGRRLTREAAQAIVADIAANRYADVHLAAFITACGGDRLDEGEIISLTKAMIEAGDRLEWPNPPIVDKHCVGGLPGNRTTPIVVSIAAAAGLTMPKTSSRAITSPAGTADTMETMAPVGLDIAAMRRVVEQEGGCIVWGGNVRLSPADDILIRVEKALDLDSEGQLVASVLSKKASAGSTHVLIDIPVGPTAKVRNAEAAARMGEQLVRVGRQVGLEVRTAISDGSQPVGRGIGPALEARDVLAVLQVEKGAPADLRERALSLAGSVLEMGGKVRSGEGQRLASQILDEGRAWKKFQAICEAQGGMRQPGHAPLRHEIIASRAGIVDSMDNRILARAAKLAGAPAAKTAGVDLHVKLGMMVEKGMPLFSLHAETPGEMSYALEFLRQHSEIISISERP